MSKKTEALAHNIPGFLVHKYSLANFWAALPPPSFFVVLRWFSEKMPEWGLLEIWMPKEGMSGEGCIDFWNGREGENFQGKSRVIFHFYK